jgi:putative tricarboxylic transport membrane protein
MIGFGLFGYLMPKFGFECAPFLLGMVLGQMMEVAFRQSLLYGDPLIFLSRPISGLFIFFSLVLLITPVFSNISHHKRKILGKLED